MEREPLTNYDNLDSFSRVCMSIDDHRLQRCIRYVRALIFDKK